MKNQSVFRVIPYSQPIQISQYGQVHLICRHHISKDTAAENLHFLLTYIRSLHNSLYLHPCCVNISCLVDHAILNNKRSTTINSSVIFDISTS